MFYSCISTAASCPAHFIARGEMAKIHSCQAVAGAEHTTFFGDASAVCNVKQLIDNLIVVHWIL